MAPVLALTASGPMLGSISYFNDIQILFKLVAGIAVFTIFMNVASGVTKFPFLKIGSTGSSAVYFDPWLAGIGIGFQSPWRWRRCLRSLCWHSEALNKLLTNSSGLGNKISCLLTLYPIARK